MQSDWERVRRVIWERDGGICMKCGKEIGESWQIEAAKRERRSIREYATYHVDHIIPIARGGDPWSLDILELSCPRCNLSKGAREQQSLSVYEEFEEPE